MTNREALQWLDDEQALMSIHKVGGEFCLHAMVADVSGEPHSTTFRLEHDFVEDYLQSVAQALRKVIDDVKS